MDWQLINASWQQATPEELSKIQAAAEKFKSTLPDDPIEGHLMWSRFYMEHNLVLMQIAELDAALIASNTSDPNLSPSIARNLAEVMRLAGFTEAALMTLDRIPPLLEQDHSPESLNTLGTIMIERGRVLDSLNRLSEAESSFAMGRRLLITAGQLIS